MTSCYKELFQFLFVRILRYIIYQLRIWSCTFTILMAIICYCNKREWNELDFISFRHNHKTLLSCLSCSRQVLYSELCLWIKLHHEVSLRFHPWSSSYAKYGLSKWMSFLIFEENFNVLLNIIPNIFVPQLCNRKFPCPYLV